MAKNDSDIEGLLTDATLGRNRKASPGLRVIALLANMDADVLALCMSGDRGSVAGLVGLMIGGAVVSAVLVYIMLSSIGTGDHAISLLVKLGISLGIGFMIYLFDRWVVGGAAAQPPDPEVTQAIERRLEDAARLDKADRPVPDDEDPTATLRRKLEGGADELQDEFDAASKTPSVSIFDKIWLGVTRFASQAWLGSLRFGVALILSGLFAIGAELAIFGDAIDQQLKRDDTAGNRLGIGQESSALTAPIRARLDRVQLEQKNFDADIQLKTGDIARLNAALDAKIDELARANAILADRQAELRQARYELSALSRRGSFASTDELITVQNRIDNLRGAVASSAAQAANLASAVDDLRKSIAADEAQLTEARAHLVRVADDRAAILQDQAALPARIQQNLIARGAYQHTAVDDFLERYIALQELQDDPRRGRAIWYIDWLLYLSLVVLEMLPLLAVLIFRAKWIYPEILASARWQRVSTQTYFDIVGTIKAREDVANWRSEESRRRRRPLGEGSKAEPEPGAPKT